MEFKCCNTEHFSAMNTWIYLRYVDNIYKKLPGMLIYKPHKNKIIIEIGIVVAKKTYGKWCIKALVIKSSTFSRIHTNQNGWTSRYIQSSVRDIQKTSQFSPRCKSRSRKMAAMAQAKPHRLIQAASGQVIKLRPATRPLQISREVIPPRSQGRPHVPDHFLKKVLLQTSKSFHSPTVNTQADH